MLMGVCSFELLIAGCMLRGELVPFGVRNLRLEYQDFCVAVLKKNCFFF